MKADAPFAFAAWLALAFLGVGDAAAEAAPAQPSASPAPAGATAAVDPTRWRPAVPGVETALRPVGKGVALLVRADPRLTRLRIERAPQDAPLTAAALLARDGALAVINASFFDSGGRPIGWIVSDGNDLAPPAPKGWGAFVVSGGQPRIVSMKDAKGPADQAIQAGPRLVIAGAANPGLKDQSARRAFIGIDAQGRIVLGCTSPWPVSAAELASFLARPEGAGGAGLVNALNLDGGSSAQLAVVQQDGSVADLPGARVPVLIEILPAS